MPLLQQALPELGIAAAVLAPGQGLVTQVQLCTLQVSASIVIVSCRSCAMRAVSVSQVNVLFGASPQHAIKPSLSWEASVAVWFKAVGVSSN